MAKQINKVMLIYPPMTLFKGPGPERRRAPQPLGISYLAAVLGNKYDVCILDCVAEGFDDEIPIDLEKDVFYYGLSKGAIKKRLEEYFPDLVGVSCPFSPSSIIMDEICNLAKSVNPEVVTVAGGAHPSALPHQTLKNKNIDYVIIGEGEFSFLQLLDSLNKGSDFSEVDGLAYRDNGGDVKVIEKKTFIKDLDELPFPARHLLPLKRYFDIGIGHNDTFIKGKPFVSMITSRGCPANCTFCSVHELWGRSYRFRSVENVIREISSLIESYNIAEIQFEDDNLIANKERARKLFKSFIENSFNLHWCVPNGIAVYLLDETMLDLMKESGCYNLSFAIESGSQYVLDRIACKPLNLSKAQSIVTHAKHIGMQTEGYFMIGFPGETKEQIQKTVDLAEKLEFDNLSFYIVTPYPGTKLYQVCFDKNYIERQPANYLRYRFSRGVITTEEFTPGYLEKVRVEEWKRITTKQRQHSVQHSL